MFCTNCGAQNSDKAVFCQKCGRMLEAEEETRIARPANIERNIERKTDDEREIFAISPTLMFVKIGYAAAALGALLLVAVLFSFESLVSIKIPWWISVLLGLSVLLIPAFYHFRQKLVRYTMTDAKIEIDQGLISRTTRNIPLRTIQDVTVSATVAQRMLGFGDLIIDNASDEAGKIVLKNIDSPKKYADILLKQMRQLNR
ncbi:MAG TPA: PH domain-containing protein [Pyrinomonadaceae bacterium]